MRATRLRNPVAQRYPPGRCVDRIGDTRCRHISDRTIRTLTPPYTGTRPSATSTSVLSVKPVRSVKPTRKFGISHVKPVPAKPRIGHRTGHADCHFTTHGRGIVRVLGGHRAVTRLPGAGLLECARRAGDRALDGPGCAVCAHFERHDRPRVRRGRPRQQLVPGERQVTKIRRRLINADGRHVAALNDKTRGQADAHSESRQNGREVRPLRLRHIAVVGHLDVGGRSRHPDELEGEVDLSRRLDDRRIRCRVDDRHLIKGQKPSQIAVGGWPALRGREGRTRKPEGACETSEYSDRHLPSAISHRTTTVPCMYG